jgi:endoribonuclease Dicer
MGASLWEKPAWDSLFQKNMVIVCTAAVLQECLGHAFIKIEQCSILIFDEAHHAKSNHPYALIMKDYYVGEPDVMRRPRIFGMTASPVDANTDVTEAARMLENLLHAKIVTASEETLNRNNIVRPHEDIARYAPLRTPFETPFHQQLKALYGDVRGFEKFFTNSKRISSEIGPWASDMYWSFAFSEAESRKRENRKELQHNKENNGQNVAKLDAQIARLQEASEYIRQHDFGLPTLSPADLSSKVILLKEYLDRYYHRTGDARCIVFVEQRQTARLLLLIFRELGGPNLHPDLLVGTTSRGSETNVTLKSQILTVQKFRHGQLNCLFSTSVAEEGLDIPQCNLVVRFDLYRSMIGYVQSRGRARHKNSTYVHMLEEGNQFHRAVVQNALQAEKSMRSFCEGLPRDRYLDKLDHDLCTLRDTQGEVFLDPVSGAKLTYRSSLSVLAHFVSAIPRPNDETNLQATYIVQRVVDTSPDRDGRHGFQCEVLLPERAPIHTAIGKTCSRKLLAKCAAAFKMCLMLRERGALNENLLPTYEEKVVAMRNAHLALSEKQKGQYLMRIKPEFWQIGLKSITERLYLTIIDVDAGLDRPHQPIGLITRAQLPHLPRFPIYLRNDRPSNVVLTPLETSFKATEEDLTLFNKVTLQIYGDIYNKIYEEDITKMTYWLVPIRSDYTMANVSTSSPENVIDMVQVRDICNPTDGRTQWTPDMDDVYLVDKYIVDKYSGGRRFYSKALAPHLKPDSPVPESAIKAEPARKYKESILDWSNSLWSGSRKFRTWNMEQPVIEVERIPFRRNFLAAMDQKEKDSEGQLSIFVCPEPLKISMMTTRFVAMVYIFPAILHRIEDYLIALEACQHLGLTINPALALEALTKDSDNSGEYGAEVINFRSGMGPNYERLEFLGDCFLKMATSISTFVLQPDENEFEFHVRRMCMLCNKNLFGTAKELKLYEWVRTMAFNRRQWYPKGLELRHGKGKGLGDGPVHHALGDKSVADVCEAFIGAAFLQDNKPGEWKATDWDQAVKAVKIFVDSEDHLMEKFSDYYAAYEKPKYQLAEATATQLDLARQIEQKHPYHFKYPRLLRSAFVHPSQAFMWEKVPNCKLLLFTMQVTILNIRRSAP